MGAPSDIGTTIKEAIGLGLAGARGLAEGLGLAQPQQPQGMFGAPAQSQPTDLGDLNLVQQLGLRFQNAVASSEGQGPAVASGQLRQRRAEGNQKRLDAFKQGVDLLKQFEGIRDKAGPADYDRVTQLLRQRFGELAGGQPGEADSFFDTFMGGGANATAGLLKLIENDAGAQQILAAGGGVGDLRAYLTSPEKLKEAMELADVEGLDEIRQRIGAWMNSQNPAYRQALEGKRQPGSGMPTLAGLRDLEELLPAGERLTASQWARAFRNEGDLADLNLTATPELLERRKAGIDSAKQREIDAARIAEQLTADIQKLEKEAELGKFKRNAGPGGTTAQQRVFADRVLTQRTKWREGMARLDQFLKTPYNGPGSYQILNGWISSLDNTAAREGEVQVVKEEAASLADRMRLKLQRFTKGAVVDENTFNEIKALMQSSRERLQELHRQYISDQVHIGTTLFGEEGPDALIPGWRETVSGQEAAAAPAQGAPAAGDIRARAAEELRRRRGQ